MGRIYRKCIGGIVSLAFTTILLQTYALPAGGQNLRGEDLLSSGVSKNQYIILADLHIIQAIQDLQRNDFTGASEQLDLAREQLNKAVG
jgi:hypothetical protein